MKTKRPWKSYLRAAALAVVIATVLNPEVRALIVLADAVGIEALLLLVVTQIRSYWPVLRAAVQPFAAVLCRLSGRIGVFSIGAFQMTLPIRPFPLLLGPVLIALSYGVRCPIRGSEL